MSLSRRTFLETLALTAASTALPAQPTASEWPSPVIDCHFHKRKTPEANLAHLNGSGVTQAFLLTHVEGDPADDIHALQAANPGRFPGYAASIDVSREDAEILLTHAVKTGAQAFGEIKSPVALDSPAMLRIYAMAAELNVPIMMHFQDPNKFYAAPDDPTPAPPGGFNTGFNRFDKILKAFPKTRFVGHANAFWANISAGYRNEVGYPPGPVKPGGLTDHWLGDYPNLFADMSATSGYNALTRDPGFTPAFLKRHSAKLLFGSDCACSDGHGANQTQTGLLAGKCIARETLTVLKQNTTPELFRKLAWENGHTAYNIKL